MLGANKLISTRPSSYGALSFHPHIQTRPESDPDALVRRDLTALEQFFLFFLFLLGLYFTDLFRILQGLFPVISRNVCATVTCPGSVCNLARTHVCRLVLALHTCCL